MIRTHQTNVEISQSVPLAVEAGADITLKVKVSCPSDCELQGTVIRILASHEADEVVIKESELVMFDGTTTETEEITVKAPIEVGLCTWRALFPAQEIRKVLHEESTKLVEFQVKPHETSLAVWDIPLPTVISQPFNMKVGAKCSAGCQLTGQMIEVFDKAGTKVGSGSLSNPPWQGTRALYWRELELAAPASEGVYSWSVRLTPAGLELPHTGASAAFSFRTNRSPEHTIKVTVIEEETADPVENAEVRLGVYRASTDEQGSAIVELPKGTYDLNLRKDGYKAEPMTVEVSADVTVQVKALTVPKEKRVYPFPKGY